MRTKKINLNRYKNRLVALIKHPFFWILTLGGNAIVLLGAIFLFIFESESPHGPKEFIDSLLWSMGTVTTIGYGSLTPVTFSGKITVLILMALGTLFVWSYMAFLVTGLINPELSSLEKEVQDIEKEVRDVEKEVQHLGQIGKKLS
jgi:voltage-gated potassium channel